MSIDYYTIKIIIQISKISFKFFNIFFEDHYKNRESINNYNIFDNDLSRSSKL